MEKNWNAVRGFKFVIKTRLMQLNVFRVVGADKVGLMTMTAYLKNLMRLVFFFFWSYRICWLRLLLAEEVAAKLLSWFLLMWNLKKNIDISKRVAMFIFLMVFDKETHLFNES